MKHYRQAIPSQIEPGQFSCSSLHVVYSGITKRKATGIKKKRKQENDYDSGDGDINGQGYNGLDMDNGSKRSINYWH